MPLDSDTMLPKHEGMSIEDLSLLCDMFYLPYQHGSRAVELLQELSWLVNFNPDSKQDVEEATLPAEWTRKVGFCGILPLKFSHHVLCLKCQVVKSQVEHDVYCFRLNNSD